MMAWASPMSILIICASVSDFSMVFCVSDSWMSHPSFMACSIAYASGYPFSFPRSMVSILTSGGICIWVNISFRS